MQLESNFMIGFLETNHKILCSLFLGTENTNFMIIYMWAAPF